MLLDSDLNKIYVVESCWNCFFLNDKNCICKFFCHKIFALARKKMITSQLGVVLFSCIFIFGHIKVYSTSTWKDPLQKFDQIWRMQHFSICHLHFCLVVVMKESRSHVSLVQSKIKQEVKWYRALLILNSITFISY